MNAGVEGGTAAVALRPRFHNAAIMSSAAPFNLARLTVWNAQTSQRLGGPFDIVVNPDSEEFDLPVEFQLPDDAGRLEVTISVELLNVTNGAESIEWSGMTSPFFVQAGQSTSRPEIIRMYPGPPGNLAVTALTIVNAPATAVEGDTLRLVAVAQGSTNIRVFWRSLAPDVATVDSGGVLRILRDGIASVVAIAGAHEDTAHISVAGRIASVRIAPDTLRAVSIGDQIAFTATALDVRGSPIAGHSYFWVGDDAGVVNSDGGGIFTATRNGTAVIRAVSISSPGLSATAVAVVRQRVTAITLDLGALAMTAVGDRHQFLPTALDARGVVITDAAVQWSSSDPAVATVDASGMVIGRASGSTVITATSDGVSASAAVTVLQTVTSLTLVPDRLSFTATGDTARFVARAVDRNGNVVATPAIVWSSSNSGVAAVDGSGFIRAGVRGSAVVTASTGGAAAQAIVTVEPVIARIAISPGNVTLNTIGASAAFVAQAFDRNDNVVQATFTWSSSTPSVATVNDMGVAIAVGRGGSEIVAAAASVRGTAQLTVEQVLTRLAAPENSVVLGDVGYTHALRVIGFDAAGNVMPLPPITWTSADPAIATVDAKGEVTSTGYGRTSITAASGDVSVSIDIEVRQPTLIIVPDSIAFTSIGATAAVAARLRDAGGSTEPVNAVWSSSDGSIATVDAAGTVTARRVGNAEIIAAFGHFTARIPVTVTVTQTTQPGHLTGRVVHAATDAGLASATVTFTGPAGAVTVVTDANGLFTSPPLTDATVDIDVSLAGYVTTHMDDAIVVANSTTPIGSIPIVPSSTQPGSISGTVQDARNAGFIGGATVTLREGMNATSGAVVRTATANSSGSFSFTGLPAGVYSLAAEAAGYATGIRPGIVLGGSSRTGQNITLSPLGSADEWRIVLTWGAGPSDLDSHLTGPSGTQSRFHVFYGNTGRTSSSPFASLDRDDTSAYGPETITISQILPGVYRYTVHHYSGSPGLNQSNAQVELYNGANRVAVFSVPSVGTGRYWTVFELNNGVVTPINVLNNCFECVTGQAGLRMLDGSQAGSGQASPAGTPTGSAARSAPGALVDDRQVIEEAIRSAPKATLPRRPATAAQRPDGFD